MSSKGAIKWLQRLEQPRTLESLITEVYGEATWFGCLFEREVADFLSFYELSRDPVEALIRGNFNTEDWSLNELLKEISKRKILTDDQFKILDRGRHARNELIHRLVAKRILPSRADKELYLAEIDELYFDVWKAHRMARDLKEHFAAKVGVTEERVNEILQRKREEGRIEDENIRRLLGDDSKA
jgi:hypothetical protein